ncbi:hypothetical protein ACQ4LE_001003 [Meloidogyne hapla]
MQIFSNSEKLEEKMDKQKLKKDLLKLCEGNKIPDSLKKLFEEHKGARSRLIELFRSKNAKWIKILSENQDLSLLTNIDSKELDNWLISNYLLLLNDNDIDKRIEYTYNIEILIQIRRFDNDIKDYTKEEEWKALRTLILEKMDKACRYQRGIFINEAGHIGAILSKISLNISNATEFNLFELVEENIVKMESKIKPEKYSKDHLFLDKLNEETIKNLKINDDEFNKRISDMNMLDYSKIHALFVGDKKILDWVFT